MKQQAWTVATPPGWGAHPAWPMTFDQRLEELKVSTPGRGFTDSMNN